MGDNRDYLEFALKTPIFLNSARVWEAREGEDKLRSLPSLNLFPLAWKSYLARIKRGRGDFVLVVGVRIFEEQG